MDQIKKAGADRVGMVTQSARAPEGRSKKK